MDLHANAALSVNKRRLLGKAGVEEQWTVTCWVLLPLVPKHVGSSGPPWRLGAAKPPSPKEDTGWSFTLTPPSA